MCWLKISWTVRQLLNIFICFSCSSVTSSHFWALRISSFKDISSFYEPGGNISLFLQMCKARLNSEFKRVSRRPTSISCGSDEGIEMCWSRHEGSLCVKIWPFPSNTSSSCKFTHNMWLCFLFSSVRWSKTAPAAYTQKIQLTSSRWLTTIRNHW